MTLFGIDISHYQPPMNYVQARLEGAAFIVHKASEGTSTDPTFTARIPAIKASGAIPGAYHFLRSTPSAAAQVSHFLSVIGDPTGLLIQLDWELSGSDLAPVSMARAWVNEWNARTGNHPVLIYLPHWVWADHLGSPGGLNTLGPLWASRYLAAPPTVLTLASGNNVPASWWAGYGGWIRPAVLQYAGEAGRIAGVSGADLNLFDGTLTDLQALTGGGDDMTPEEHSALFDGVLGGALSAENVLYYWLRSTLDGKDPLVQAAYGNTPGYGLRQVQGDLTALKAALADLGGKVDHLSIPPAAQVDAAALAAQLRDHLGPDLIAALAAQLVK